VAVAIAADPVAESNGGLGGRVGPGKGPEPGLAEALRGEVHHIGKDAGEVVQNVAQLGFHVGTLEEDFAGAPQALKAGLDAFAEGGLLHGTAVGVLALDQQEVELAVAVEDGGAFGFGRMRGQDGLHVDAGQNAADVFGGKAGVAEELQLMGPGADLAGRSVKVLTHAADLVGGVLLGHVEEVEGDGEGLGTAGRETVAGRGRDGEGGRDQARQIALTDGGEDVAEAVEQEAEVVVPLLKAGLAEDGAVRRHGSGNSRMT